jgi:hypothetical protein
MDSGWQHAAPPGSITDYIRTTGYRPQDVYKAVLQGLGLQGRVCGDMAMPGASNF